MILRRLEAYGFKSFADKTEIEFGPGITVVVGPNGSGKSNISDAIRWVLGEQSVRTLRGTKMEDVIFAGSSGRRPLGIAEVSLTFDNSDGTLPLDFNEVIITRRVYRSGDSEYFINKALCRLKDIYELLADTGLGRDAMSVIGQNKVDEILNSKPEDRRLIFEDSAGITKYKQRKKEALRKLEDTTQNLIRVSDITNEIEVQLAPLAESAERTAKYNKLHTELTSCQVTLLLNILEKSEKMVESATMQKDHLSEQELAASSNVSIKETEKIQLTTQLVQVDEELTAYTNSINQADTELERIKGKIALVGERIIHAQRSSDRNTDEQERIKQQKNEIVQKISVVHESLADKNTQAEKLASQLDGKNMSYQNILTEIGITKQQLEFTQGKTLEYVHEVVGERNKIITMERDLGRIHFRKNEIDQEYQDYVTQLNHGKTAHNNIIAEEEVVGTTLATLHNEKNGFIHAKQRIEENLERICQQEKKIVTHVNELNSRFKILTNMQKEYEGFARGIKSVLKSDAIWSQGICGAVAQILTVPDKYVTAIEIALGGALQHIITENAGIAKQAIEFLKTKNLGRATFLPLESIKPSRPREREIAAAKTPGSLGFAASLVSVEPRYRLVIENLLGRTIIAENIDIALRIAKQQEYSVKIVTLGGEVLNPGGSMTGGSTNKRESSFLSRGNTLTAIEQSLEELKTSLALVAEQVSITQSELITINHDLAINEEKRQKSQVRQAEIAVHADKIQLDINRISVAINTSNGERNDCIRDEAQLTEALANTRIIVAQLENRDSEHQQLLTVSQQKFNDLQRAKETLQSSITDAKVELTAVQQEIAGIVASCQQYEQSTEVLVQQLQQLLRENNELAIHILEANQELSATKEQHTALLEQKASTEERRKAQYTVKMSVLTTLQLLEKEIKELRRKSSDLQARLHEIELMATKYSYEVNNSREKLAQQFSLTIEEAKLLRREDSIGNITKLTRELERDIAALGPVNHAALTEYTSLQSRYEFLQKQYQDLVSAKEYLSSIIIDIDKTMSAKFTSAFTKIIFKV